MPQALHILIVDDMAANCRLLSRFVESLGHQAELAYNGAEAVEACRKRMPDLVLMDIMMPVMDGVHAAMEIRELAGDHWLPIIFLSAKNEESDQLEVLEVGDDFLSKPVNQRILAAKIKVMARIAEMQQRLADHATRLSAYQRDSEHELQFAGQMLDRIIRYKETETDRIRQWLKPARHLSGDVIVHATAPDGKLHFLIADSTGHGLSAAICTLPVVDTFFTMTEKGLGIDKIVREINAKLHLLLPRGRFVASALVSVDERQVQFWNGGIPFAVFLSCSGKIIKEWPSQYPPLGMLSDSQFDESLETWQWPEPGEIFISSDGIVEEENEQGEFLGTDALKRVLELGEDHAFDNVIFAAQNHLGKNENRDDLSLAAITCS